MAFQAKQLTVLFVESNRFILIISFVNLYDVVNNTFTVNQTSTHIATHTLSFSDFISQSSPRFRVVELNLPSSEPVRVFRVSIAHYIDPNAKLFLAASLKMSLIFKSASLTILLS